MRIQSNVVRIHSDWARIQSNLSISIISFWLCVFFFFILSFSFQLYSSPFIFLSPFAPRNWILCQTFSLFFPPPVLLILGQVLNLDPHHSFHQSLGVILRPLDKINSRSSNRRSFKAAHLRRFGMLTLKYFMMPSKSWAKRSFFTIISNPNDTWILCSKSERDVWDKPGR